MRHWWIESNGILVDITADQFNLIEDSALSYKIKSHRPYHRVYCLPKEEAPHHKVFKLVPKELWVWNEKSIGEIKLDVLRVIYRRLHDSSHIQEI